MASVKHLTHVKLSAVPFSRQEETPLKGGRLGENSLAAGFIRFAYFGEDGGICVVAWNREIEFANFHFRENRDVTRCQSPVRLYLTICHGRVFNGYFAKDYKIQHRAEEYDVTHVLIKTINLYIDSVLNNYKILCLLSCNSFYKVSIVNFV